MSIELVILASHLRMFNISILYDDERILTTFGFNILRRLKMRMICLVNYESKSVTVYSLCVRHKHNLFIERELVPVDSDIYSLTHYDINMSWRRFKKGIQKQGLTFTKNGINSLV